MCPLRTFGGRAGYGTIQHGTANTNAAGLLTIVFPVPFVAPPDISCEVFAALVIIEHMTVRTRTALGFTAQCSAVGVNTVMWIAVL